MTRKQQRKKAGRGVKLVISVI